MDEGTSDTPLPEWLVAARDANERERQGAIAELDALAGEVDAARLFVALLANMAFVPAGEWRESMHGILAAQVELLAFELVPRFGRSTSDRITPWHVQRGLAAIEALSNAEQRTRTFDSLRTAAADPPEGGPGGFDSLLSHLRIDAEIVRGSAYPEQTRREIEEIQGHFEAEFAGFAGIGPKRAIALAFALVGVVEDRLNATLAAARPDLDAAETAWARARRRRRGELSAAEQDLLATFRSAADARTFKGMEHLARTAPDQLPVASADIRLDPPLTDDEWVAYCRLIGRDQAARSRMSAPIEMRERPLYVLPDGRVFPYDISNTLDQLWAAFEREARLANPSWVGGVYAHHRGKWLEDQIVQFLQRIFPAGRIYRHLSYPDPNHAGRTAEIDVIVHWPPFLMLVEAKAVQFQLEGQLGNTRLLKNDLRANIQNAFWQADRAARCIQQGEEAHFTEIDGGRVLMIRRGDLRRTYLTTVSQHTLAGIATRLAATRPLGLFRDDQYPWALSIADLDIITQFCPGPDVLLHYVERRLSIQAEKINLIGDELDFFGAYLDTRLQPDRIWLRDGEPFDLISLSGFQEPFDEAMAFRRGELPAAPDVRLAVPDEIAAILGALRQHASSPDERWIAFSLLSLPDRALGAVAHLLREIRAQTLTPGAFRSGVYGEDYWVVIAVATLDRSPDDLYQATGSRTTLEKYRRRARRAIGIGMLAGARSQPFECVLWGDNLWEHDERIEELLREQPPAAYLPDTRLPGRNQPCICGSGRKFKHCCLPRLEAARRNKPN